MRSYFHFFLFAAMLIVLPGCEAIGNIFKAGMWAGVLAVLILAAAVLYFIRKGK